MVTALNVETKTENFVVAAAILLNIVLRK